MPALSPAQLLDRAARRFAAAEHFRFRVTGSRLPAGADALTAADGVAVRPDRVAGEFTIRRGSGTMSVHVTSIGGTVWTKVPLLGWVQTDPARFGLPDPAALLSQHHGLTTLLQAIEPTGGSGRTVTGTVPAAKLASLLPSTRGHRLHVRLRVDGAGRPTLLRLDGVRLATAAAPSTYTLAFSDYDAPLRVDRP